MDIMKIIKARRSVRTFDGREISQQDKDKLCDYIKTIRNPFDIPVEFILLDAKEHGLSSPVIEGEHLYVTAKVPKVPHSEEAFGYSFEKMVLCAWSLGIGTTWIAATFKRPPFEKAVNLQDGEKMYCISPLGYPSEKMSDKEIKMRKSINADNRQPATELFFDGDFNTPLTETDEKIQAALEAVRIAPSATNKQPWRIVKVGNNFNFYVEHTKGYVNEKTGDVQKIDLGIALCHFMSVIEGTCKNENPNLSAADNLEYIATVTV